jgi:hypothetical protein
VASEVRVGDTVEILKGKRQGMAALVKELEDQRVVVEIEDVDYEVSYQTLDVKVVLKASTAEKQFNSQFLETPQRGLYELTGDKKRRLEQFLVKSGVLCPSFPYSCSGQCKVVEKEEVLQQKVNK